MEWSYEAVCVFPADLDIDGGTGLDERGGIGLMSTDGGIMEGGMTGMIEQIGIGLVLQQQAHDGVLAYRVMQRGPGVNTEGVTDRSS